jgi:2'-5' RNA ligase
VIRAFVAAELDNQVLDNISKLIEILKPRLPAVRWTPKTNLHLTLKFLGNIEESQVNPVTVQLRASLKLFPRCTINAKGLGVFPDVRRPKILWVGLSGDLLAQLAASVEAALVPLGFTSENRVFTPHLTIGRWREGSRPTTKLRQEIESWSRSEFGACAVEQIVLFQSVLRPEGASYSELAIVQLGSDITGT